MNDAFSINFLLIIQGLMVRNRSNVSIFPIVAAIIPADFIIFLNVFGSIHYHNNPVIPSSPFFKNQVFVGAIEARRGIKNLPILHALLQERIKS